MKLFSGGLYCDFEVFLLRQLRMMYDAEFRLIEALPRLQRGAKNRALSDFLAWHQIQTAAHIDTLELLFQISRIDAKRERSRAAEALIQDALEAALCEQKGDILDAGLIISLQRIEHNGIADCQGIKSLANLLAMQQAVDLIELVLEDFRRASTKLLHLTGVAVNESCLSFSNIDRKAVHSNKSYGRICIN